MVLAVESHLYFGVPVMSPATSFFFTGSVPSNLSPSTQYRASSWMIATKSGLRVVERTSLLTAR